MAYKRTKTKYVVAATHDAFMAFCAALNIYQPDDHGYQFVSLRLRLIGTDPEYAEAHLAAGWEKHPQAAAIKTEIIERKLEPAYSQLFAQGAIAR